MVRAPFHFGLFYHAMIGLIGREPDDRICYGLDGFYDIRYRPRDNAERIKFREHAAKLAQWLDIFDIQFSGSRCEYGSLNNAIIDDELLQIKITHLIEKR